MHQSFSYKKRYSNKNFQRGSATVLAVFIMVVVLMFSTVIINIFSASNEGIAQEVIGTRALAAANSAMQGQLQVLFPHNGAVGSCNASTDYDFSTVTGLFTCEATVSCTNYAQANDIDYYQLKSTGTCGSGTVETDSANVVLSSRTVIVEAKEL